MEYYPLVILAVGIATVIGLILVLRLNAFLALISAAIVVSLMAPGPIAEKISRVAFAFGASAGTIGVVIALAAIIGTCLMESGAADRIVRFFLKVLGEERAPTALMGSGFILAIPVFFDTVFYLLVPLGRSLFRRTKKHYLKYVMAIACGGAITHALVPPTPGPLLMAANLGIDLGVMILIGLAVALPAAMVGLVFCGWADRRMTVPMRPIAGVVEPTPPSDDQLPPLGLAILPVVLPVLLITANTVLNTMANAEHAARFTPADVVAPGAFVDAIFAVEPEPGSPMARLDALLVPEFIAPESAVPSAEAVALALNERVLPRREAALALSSSPLAKLSTAEVERANRLVLEELYPESVLRRQTWETPTRQASNLAAFFGDANFALLLSAAVSMLLVVRQKGASRVELANMVEQSLMSAGVIILITAGGGAFGAMLQQAQIGAVLENVFGRGDGPGASSGMVLLLVGFGVAAVLKIAQGSSTVAMITASGIIAALLPASGAIGLGYHPAYLATAIGSGSLIGSWMNDSGFWVFAKMSGLTEAEALKSWTPLLLVLGTVGLIVSVILALLVPLTGLA